jgi:hypothetical protein
MWCAALPERDDAGHREAENHLLSDSSFDVLGNPSDRRSQQVRSQLTFVGFAGEA